MSDPVAEPVRIVKPYDADYPLPMLMVDNYEKYSIIKVGETYCIPLFQVIDQIAKVKSDYTIRNGIKYCSNCGAELGVAEK